jgi:hypothetical protein
MELPELQSKIRFAFSSLTRPAKETITSCTCWECTEIRDDFGSSDPEDLPDKLMGYHCRDLGFMTPGARLYFLRGWMELAIQQPGRPYGEAVCDILCRDDSWIEKSNPGEGQIEAMIDFLEYLRAREGNRPGRECAHALEILRAFEFPPGKQQAGQAAGGGGGQAR